MGRAAGDIEVDRQDAIGAVVRLRVIPIYPAGDGTGSNRDNDLGGGHRLVRFLKRELHVLSHRAGDQEAIGVPGRGDELNAEPAEIEDDRPEHIDVDLAAVTSSRAHLPEPERPPEQAEHFVVELPRQRLLGGVADQKSGTRVGGQAIFAGELNPAGGAGVLALAAEEASSQIYDRIPLRYPDRIRRTGVQARGTTLAADSRADFGTAAEPLRHGGRLIGETDGAAS